MVRDRRKNFRVEWNSPAKIYSCDGHVASSCILSNFSNGGARLTGVRTVGIPDDFVLRVKSSHSPLHKCRVLWRTDDTLGVEFVAPTTGLETPNTRRMARKFTR
jgi:PilZ domain